VYLDGTALRWPWDILIGSSTCLFSFLLEEEDGGKIKRIEGVIGHITYET
jgi:hypothetical protein